MRCLRRGGQAQAIATGPVPSSRWDGQTLTHEAALQRGSKQTAIAPKLKRTVPVSDKARKDLTRRKARIKAGADTNALAWFAQVLSSTSGLSRYGDVDLTEVRKAYGEALTAAVEQGLKALWRNEAPRRDESNPRSTYWLTIAGLHR